MPLEFDDHRRDFWRSGEILMMGAAGVKRSVDAGLSALALELCLSIFPRRLWQNKWSSSFSY